MGEESAGDQPLHPREMLLHQAASHNVSVMSAEFADIMDKQDPLADYRQHFHYPKAANCPSG